MGMGWIIANGLSGASKEMLDQAKQKDKEAEDKQRWEAMYQLQKQSADQQADQFRLNKAEMRGKSFMGLLQQQQAASPAAQQAAPAQASAAPVSTPVPENVSPAWETGRLRAAAQAPVAGPAAQAPQAPTLVAAPAPAGTPAPASTVTPNASTYAQAAAQGQGQGQERPTSMAEILRKQYSQIEAQQSGLKQAMEAQADKEGLTGDERAAFLAPAGQYYSKLQETKMALEEKLGMADIQESSTSIAQLMMMNPKGLTGSQMVKQLKENGTILSKSAESLLSMIKPSTQAVAGQSVTGYLVPTPIGAPSFVPDFVAVRLLASGDIKGFADAAQQWAEHKGDLTMRLQAMHHEAGKASRAENYALAAAKGISALNANGGKWNELPLDQQAAILMVNPASAMARDQSKENHKKTAADYKALSDTYDKMNRAYLEYGKGNIDSDNLSQQIQNLASGYVSGGQGREWGDVADMEQEIRSKGWFRGNETVNRVVPKNQSSQSVSSWSPKVPSGGGQGGAGSSKLKVTPVALAQAKAAAKEAVARGANRDAVARRLKEQTGYEGGF